jgi:signal transduction histidine kinase
LILLLICSAYRYRLYQMDRQYNLRLEERVGERTRIAQELHDTLLQGFLSASMQLDAATDGLPADSPSKAPLSRVLHLMRQVIEEGRTAVRGLRSSQDSSFDLAQAFSRIREELTVEEGIAFRVSVEGQPQPLRPVLRDEVYRIGREALTNAFRHSRATKVEAGLEYSAKQFRLLVSDNGRGIDPGVLQSGREGHWGIHGMRERAKKIGVRLNLRSRIAAGTEVELSIPNHIAFEHETSDGFLGRVRATILEARGRKARQKPKRMQV